MATSKATSHDDVETAKNAGGLEITIPTIPFDAVVEVARLGVQLGLGLVALAYDGAQKIAIDAIERGAKIEKKGVKSFGEFEKTQVAYMKDYLKRVQGGVRSVQPNIEAHVEEALKTHDVPTREDIRELNEQIAELSKKVAGLKK